MSFPKKNVFWVCESGAGDATEAVAAADGPEDGAAGDAELGLDLVDEVVGRPCGPVELVHEGEKRQPPQPRNLARS